MYLIIQESNPLRVEVHNNKPIARPTPTKSPTPEVRIHFARQVQWGINIQCLQITLHREKYSISPRMCRFPQQGNLARGHQWWKICYIAQSHRWGCEKALPRSNETNQGHMWGIKQNIISTKENKQPLTYQLDNGETLTIPLQKHQDIYVKTNDVK